MVKGPEFSAPGFSAPGSTPQGPPSQGPPSQGPVPQSPVAQGHSVQGHSAQGHSVQGPAAPERAPDFGPPGPHPAFAGPPAFTDDVDLSTLPPPDWPGQRGDPGSVSNSAPMSATNSVPMSDSRRPAVVTTAAVMAITGSWVWISALGFAWLVVVSLRAELAGSGDVGTALFHRLTAVHYSLSQGVAWPAFGLPLACVVVALFLFSGVRWSLYAITGLGMASCVVAWTVLGTGGIGVPLIGYVLFCCALLWTRGARRWFASKHVRQTGDAHFDTNPSTPRMDP